MGFSAGLVDPILILAGGLVSGAIAIFNSVATMAAISSLDNSTMAGLEAYVQQESGGAFGADSLKAADDEEDGPDDAAQRRDGALPALNPARFQISIYI